MEDGLAVVNVVLGQQLVERIGIAADATGLILIELAEPVRDLGFLDER